MDYFDDVFISFLDKDSILCIHFQWRDRKLSEVLRAWNNMRASH